MRILVAGGGGFIGSHLVDRFLDRGDEVVVLDSFSTGRHSNLEHRSGHVGCQVVECDITEPLPGLGEFEAVVNLASPASPEDFASMPLEILQAGSVGNRQLLDLANNWGARFLLASTSEVYGDSLVHPQSEDYRGNVDPIGPRSCYDEAKRFAEATTMAYARRRGLDIGIARIFNTYGERMMPTDGRVVNAFIVQALREEPLHVFGDGTQTRSFCYVSDLVEGIYRLLMSNLNKPVNIGNPIEMTIQQMAGKILKICGGTQSKIIYTPLPEDDPKVRQPNISKAKKRLKWEPHVKLDEGLKTTMEYFKEQLNISNR